MNAHVIRLDALGRRLTEMAHLDKGEFNFDSRPLWVDLKGSSKVAVGSPDISGMLDGLSRQITDREHQLSVLESLISTRNLSRQIAPAAGRSPRAGSRRISVSVPIRSPAARPTIAVSISPAPRARRSLRSHPE